jgi:predicted transcriptional regulator
MLLQKVKELLNAQVLCGEDQLSQEVHSAFASDFMSDVLAFVKNQDLLLTGMMNSQVIRTAEMMDMKCIVFVRGKLPDESVIEMGRAQGMVLMATSYRMYPSCGILYSAGLAAE